MSTTTASDLSAAPTPRALHHGLWVAQIALAFLYGMAGTMKATQPVATLVQNGVTWTADVPLGLVRFIGTCELLGAAGLVLPALTRIRPALTTLAALGLVAVQVLAVPFHLSRGEAFPMPLSMNLALLALAAFVAWGRWKRAPIPPR